MYSKISFEGGKIRIGPKYTPDEYFVITRQELSDHNTSAAAVVTNQLGRTARSATRPLSAMTSTRAPLNKVNCDSY